jgi:prolyl oligopeptidase
VPEFGSAATPQGAGALRVASAYHQVKDGTAYPGVLLTTGYNDMRVDPSQAGKMAARLQAATAGGKPVLLRVDFESGHGPAAARARRLEELADIYSFVLWQLGDPQFQPSIVEDPARDARPPFRCADAGLRSTRQPFPGALRANRPC